jgi:hypothetical protein
MSWTKAVYSSMVSEIGYDDEAEELVVRWARGKESGYKGVPEDVAIECANAPSVGEYINSEIKPSYPHRYR